MKVKVLFSSALILLLMYLGFGALIFWGNQTDAESIDRTALDPYELVVVFSGGEERIKPAFDLVMRKSATQLLISSADESQIVRWSAKYANGERVPHILETKATSTHENAYFCAEIIRKTDAKRIVLITSSYHMDRAYRLLALALRDKPVEILAYPVHPFGLDDIEAISRTPFYRALVQIERTNTIFNFLKFMKDGLCIRQCSPVEHTLEQKYNSVVKRKLGKYEMYRSLRSL